MFPNSCMVAMGSIPWSVDEAFRCIYDSSRTIDVDDVNIHRGRRAGSSQQQNPRARICRLRTLSSVCKSGRKVPWIERDLGFHSSKCTRAAGFCGGTYSSAPAQLRLRLAYQPMPRFRKSVRSLSPQYHEDSWRRNLYITLTSMVSVRGI